MPAPISLRPWPRKHRSSRPPGPDIPAGDRRPPSVRILVALAASLVVAFSVPATRMAAASPTLSISPSPLANGANLAVSGSGYDPGSMVVLMWQASEGSGDRSLSPSNALGTLYADSSGNIGGTFPALVPSLALTGLSQGSPALTCPDTVGGEAVYAVESLDSVSPPRSDPQPIAVTPWLAPIGGDFGSGSASYAIPAGGSATIGGCFFPPGQSFTVSATGLTTADGTVASDGSLETTVSAAADAPRSSGTLTVSVGSHSASFPYLVYKASMSLGSAKVNTGASFTLSGSGFTPGTTLSAVGWGIPPTSGLLRGGASDVHVAPDGTFETTWDVPTDQAAGDYYVQVLSSDGIAVGDPLSSKVSVARAVPDTLSFTSQPGSLTDGQSFDVAVSLIDPSTGNVDTSAIDSINLRLVPPSGGQGSLVGTTDQAAVNGVADFSGVSIAGASGDGYMLEASDATSGDVLAVTSNAFTVSQAAGADALAFKTVPTAVTDDVPFDVSVQLLNPATGEADTGVSDTVKLSLVKPSGAMGTLLGTLSAQAAAGVASFSGLAVSGGSGNGYAIRATDVTAKSVLAVTTPAFTVAPQPDELSLGFLPTDVATGSTFTIVADLNKSGGTDTAATDTLTITANAPAGQSTSLTGTTSVAAVDGEASFHVAFASGAGPGFSLTVADATNSAVAAVTSDRIAIVDPSQDYLEFTQPPPANVQPDTDITVAVQAVNPLTGKVDTANGDEVDLSLLYPAGFPASLAGTVDGPLADGAETFDVAVEGGDGAGYSLKAIDASQSSVTSATSNSFSLPFTPVATSSAISFTAQPDAIVATNEQVRAQVSAAVYDQVGDPMTTQEVRYELLNASGTALTVTCPDGETASACVMPITDGGATLTATLDSTYGTSETGNGFTLDVVGWLDAQAVGDSVSSQPFAMLSARPLLVPDDSTAYTRHDNGWGGDMPSYDAPATTAGYSLPFVFGGQQFTVYYTAGDHVVIGGDSPSSQFCVDGDWQLMITGGPGSGVDKNLSGSGCGAPLDLATLSLPTGTYGGELIYAAPSGALTYGADDTVMYTPGNDIRILSLSTLPQSFRLIELATSPPSTPAVGGGAVEIPVLVSSAPLSVSGIHAEASWDPTVLQLQIEAPDGGSIGYGAVVPGHAGFMASPVSAATSGQEVLKLDVRCLASGTFPVTLSGSWWYQRDEDEFMYAPDVSQGFSYTAEVACAAPAPTATAGVAGVAVDPNDGSLVATVTGQNLSSATQALLLDASGATEATSSFLTPDASGHAVTARFASVPGGVYDLKVEDGANDVLAAQGSVDIPPALPYFTVTETDQMPQVPGFDVTHFWQVTNTGDVDGVVVLGFVFPPFVHSEPALNISALPAGSSLLEHDQSLNSASGTWTEIVSVPVQAGQTVDVPWQVTLDPNAVFGSDPVLSAGDTMPMVAMRLGMVSTAQATALGILSGPAAGFGTRLAGDSNFDLVQALGTVDGLTGASASAYEAYLRVAYPILAEQVYDQDLLTQVDSLLQAAQAGIVTIPGLHLEVLP